MSVRKDNLDILHEKFMAETNIDRSYRHIEVVKPCPEDWGSSLGKTYLNTKLKIKGLRKSIDSGNGVTLEGFLSLREEELNEFEVRLATQKLVTYKE